MSDINTQISRGFDAGNYANAYETTNLTQALARLSMNRSEHYIHAYILGFFSSYTLDEMSPHEETYLNAYHSPAGEQCLKAGYIDPIAEETTERHPANEYGWKV